MWSAFPSLTGILCVCGHGCSATRAIFNEHTCFTSPPPSPSSYPHTCFTSPPPPPLPPTHTRASPLLLPLPSLLCFTSPPPSPSSYPHTCFTSPPPSPSSYPHTCFTSPPPSPSSYPHTCFTSPPPPPLPPMLHLSSSPSPSSYPHTYAHIRYCAVTTVHMQYGLYMQCALCVRVGCAFCMAGFLLEHGEDDVCVCVLPLHTRQCSYVLCLHANTGVSYAVCCVYVCMFICLCVCCACCVCFLNAST